MYTYISLLTQAHKWSTALIIAISDIAHCYVHMLVGFGTGIVILLSPSTVSADVGLYSSIMENITQYNVTGTWRPEFKIYIEIIGFVTFMCFILLLSSSLLLLLS